MARASLEELLLDFEDYLRHRRLPQWAPDAPEARAVRAVARGRKQGGRSDSSDQFELTGLTDQERWALYAPWLEHAEAAVRANAVICLIHQANYLLDQQLVALEQAFIAEGGYSEQLATARIAQRSRRRDPTDAPDLTDPPGPAPRCPQCGKLMALRTAKTGQHAGSQFWGCTGYPECKGTIEA